MLPYNFTYKQLKDVYQLDSENKIKIFRDIVWIRLLVSSKYAKKGLLNGEFRFSNEKIKDLDLTPYLKPEYVYNTFLSENCLNPELIYWNSSNIVDKNIIDYIQKKDSFVRIALRFSNYLLETQTLFSFFSFLDCWMPDYNEHDFFNFFKLYNYLSDDIFDLRFYPQSLFYDLEEDSYYTDIIFSKMMYEDDQFLSEDQKKRSYTLKNFSTITNITVCSNFRLLVNSSDEYREILNKFNGIYDGDFCDLYIFTNLITKDFLKEKENNSIPFEWWWNLVDVDEYVDKTFEQREVLTEAGFWKDPWRVSKGAQPLYAIINQS